MVHVGLLRIYSGFIYGRLMVLEVIEADLGVFSPAGWIKDYLQNVFRHQSHQRTEGPRDQKTRGPRDRRRTKGPKDQGTRGPRDQGTKGPENQGTRGPRERTEGPGDSKTTRFENCIKGPKHCTSAGKMNIFLGIPYFFFDALNVFFWCLIFFLEPHASSSQLQEGRKRESVDGIAGRWRQFDGPAGCSHDKMFPNVWCMWKASWSPGEQRWHPPARVPDVRVRMPQELIEAKAWAIQSNIASFALLLFQVAHQLKETVPGSPAWQASCVSKTVFSIGRRHLVQASRSACSHRQGAANIGSTVLFRWHKWHGTTLHVKRPMQGSVAK